MEEKPAELPASPSQGGPVSEQEVQIQPPSLLDKIKIHKFKILGGALGLLVFTGAVFGAYKFGQRQAQPAPGSTPTPVVVATPTPDPTADWKIYTNTKYGYSIKYPSEWILSAPEVCIPSCPEAADNMSTVRPPGVKYPEGDFSVTSWTKGFEPQVLDQERSKSEARSWNWKSRQEEIIEVNGYEAWSIAGEMEFSDNKAYFRHYIVVKTSSGLWEINLWDTKEQIYRNTFNLMLSTFKFTSEEAVGERVFCQEPRPEVCTMECITNPPYICGSDGKSYCSECQACSHSAVEWYVIQDEPCGSK